ncbi:hypothetical protein R1flu_011572 [Riccia fluitans]|uniref:DUF7804 domain-containing protein n=1 Tax=Riccia fluitans TaxID=41844 RepID=A0ABD1Z925_9MARC
MALSLSVQNFHLHLGSSTGGGQTCGSSRGTRKNTTLSPLSVCCGAEWKRGPASSLKFHICTVGLHRLVPRFSYRQRSSSGKKAGVFYAQLEKHSVLSALGSLSPASFQENSRIPAGDIELNYTTVKEIVENLQDAPFLQYVYSANQGGRPARLRLSEEFFEKPDTWGPVRKCLLDAAPDGIIMVQRLDRNNPSECCLIEKSCDEIGAHLERREQDGESASLEDYWGLLVHGCKARCNKCYLLRTTRQPSPSGFTTYFMLIRAECFGPSIENQFRRASLV